MTATDEPSGRAEDAHLSPQEIRRAGIAARGAMGPQRRAEASREIAVRLLSLDELGPEPLEGERRADGQRPAGQQRPADQQRRTVGQASSAGPGAPGDPGAQGEASAIARGTRRIAGYWPHGDEVDLRSAWDRLHQVGVHVHLPRVLDDTAMGFPRWSSGCDMEPNRWGIPEPTGVARAVGDMDVVVVPATAVDRAGHRVGMGAGYYDRALDPRLPPAAGNHPRPQRPLLVGVVFECQLVDHIDANRWDVPMDVVLTESSLLRFPGNR